MLQDDRKDAIMKTVQNFRKLIGKYLMSISDADPEIVIRAMGDPAGVYLRQHLTPEGLQVTEPQVEMQEGRDFIRKLPEEARCKEEIDLIVNTLDHTSKAHAHMSSMCTNLSSLAKIMDWQTFQMVLKATVRPLMQVNMPECFLNPIEDTKLQMSVEKQMEKVQNMILPRHNMVAMEQQPKNGSTRILVAVVWLKLNCKFFNAGTAKQACELFKVQVKQLSRVLTGRKYLGRDKKKTQQAGPKEQGKKQKSAKSHTTVKQVDDDDDDDNDPNLPPAKESRSIVKGWPN